MVKIIKKNNTQSEMLDGVREYVKLRQQMQALGVFDRAYGYYTFITIITFVGLFFSAYKIFVSPISVELILWCLFMAFFTVQVGGLVHDAGHRAIMNSTKFNDLLGHIFGSIVIMGYSHWKPNHNKHHAHTNQEDEDPDLELLDSCVHDVCYGLVSNDCIP